MSVVVLLGALQAAAAATTFFAAQTFTGTIPVTPFLSPDNTEQFLVALIDAAATSVDVHNQYFSKYSTFSSWGADDHAVVRALVRAAGRGVRVRLIVATAYDQDNIVDYLDPIASAVAGGGARYLGPDIGHNHNKGLVIDGARAVVGSINGSQRSIQVNREAGVVLEDPDVAAAYTALFEEDWVNAESARRKGPVPVIPPHERNAPAPARRDYVPIVDFPTLSAPKAVTVYANPAASYDVTLGEIARARESLHVQIYAMSYGRIIEAVLAAKRARPGLDVRIIVSSSHSSPIDSTNTASKSRELFDELVGIWESTEDLGYTHSKFWIVDGERVTIYSGNWSGRSHTDDPSTASGDNRDWGAVIEDTETADWFEQLFQRDLALATPFDTRAPGTTAFSLPQASASGTVDVHFAVIGSSPTHAVLDGECQVPLVDVPAPEMLAATIPTSLLCDGAHTLTVNGETAGFNSINSGAGAGVGILITEVLFDGRSESSDEYVGITNLFPFAMDLGGWRVGAVDQSSPFVFPSGARLDAGQTVIVARSASGFDGNFPGEAPADFEFSRMSMANSQDNIALFDGSGAIVDVVAWGAPAGGVEPFLGSTSNMESIRRRANVDTDDCDADFEVVDAAPRQLAEEPPAAVDCDGAAAAARVCGGEEPEEPEESEEPEEPGAPGDDDGDHDDDDDDDDDSASGDDDDDDDDQDKNGGGGGGDDALVLGASAAAGAAVVGSAVGVALYRRRRGRGGDREMYSVFNN